MQNKMDLKRTEEKQTRLPVFFRVRPLTPHSLPSLVNTLTVTTFGDTAPDRLATSPLTCPPALFPCYPVKI